MESDNEVFQKKNLIFGFVHSFPSDFFSRRQDIVTNA